MGQILNKLTKTKTNFNDLPPEIKEYILSYLCDSNAFTAASVCEEWKVMLGTRFKQEDTVIIGERNGDHMKYRCDDSNDCAKGSKHLSPKVMLKASADHKLNVHLEIHNPVTEVDSKVVTKGLLSVSRISLINIGRNPLSFHQLDKLFKALEKGDKVMENVELRYLDLTELNQDRLVHCLVDKTKSLKLFVDSPPLKLGTVKQLFNNIITRPVKLNTLLLFCIYDFSTLINPEDLKKLINKMDKIRLASIFTPEQKEAAKSLPDVKVDFIITKGF